MRYRKKMARLKAEMALLGLKPPSFKLWMQARQRMMKKYEFKGSYADNCLTAPTQGNYIIKMKRRIARFQGISRWWEIL